MKRKAIIVLENFEGISESRGAQLVGGFSRIFSHELVLTASAANNCKGGNCAPGCGVGGDQNTGCNIADGCGRTL